MAQQYRWLDEKGRVQYTDTPPPPSAKGVQKKNLKGSVVEAPRSFELDRATKASPITLYTSPGCGPSCDNARNTLNARGVPFKEVQVYDEASVAELQKFSSGKQVPVILVGSQVHTGYSQATYDRMLDVGGYPKAGIVPKGKIAPPPLPEGYQPPTPAPAADPAAKK